MLRRYFLLILFAAAIFLPFSCNMEMETGVPDTEESFTFAFLTDIHLQPERDAIAGFESAIDKVNKLNPAFVITGGDLIMDALGVSYGRSDSLYDLYAGMAGKFNMPVYNTIGNHEIYGWYEKSGADETHPEYGKKMYEKRIGPRYQVIEHKGWKIFILDSVEDNGEGGYKGGVDEEQLAWIEEELSATDASQPLAISVHIPLMTVGAQIFKGATEPNSPGIVITNSKEVLELFRDYNLKLVLQGHLHYLEDIYVFGTHFITAGAVSGRWWRGPNLETEEGFLMVEVSGDDFDWDYVDYGWEVEE